MIGCKCTPNPFYYDFLRIRKITSIICIILQTTLLLTAHFASKRKTHSFSGRSIEIKIDFGKEVIVSIPGSQNTWRGAKSINVPNFLERVFVYPCSHPAKRPFPNYQLARSNEPPENPSRRNSPY